MVPAPFDYSKLTLTDEEQAIFDRFRDSDTAVLTRKEYHILRKWQLITVNMDGEDPWDNDDIQSGVCKLSPHGKRLRAYQKRLRKTEATARFRHWVPVAISTVLSVIAIIISIIALYRTF